MYISSPAKRRNRSGGFSLLEMLAVVVIMGILGAVIVPRISGHAVGAKKEACKQYVGDINTALERYWFDSGAYATSFTAIENSDYYPTTVPPCPVDGTPYTIDGTSHRVNCPH